MNIIKIAFSVFIILICFWYWLTWDNQKISKEVAESLFDTNPYTSYQNIINQGFEKVKEIDVILFEKQKSDTILQIEMTDDLKVIRFQQWKIKLKSKEYKYVIDFFDKYDVEFIVSIDSIDTTKNIFYVNHYYDCTTFTCFIKVESGVSYLYVNYNYPVFPENRIKFRPKL